MTTSGNLLQNYFSKLYIPRITWTDVIEIIIIAVVLYNILLWIMNTKAWALLKGIIVVALFAVVAYLLNLKTILWIAGKTISVGIIALVIIFQPELRRALEQLGRKRFMLRFFNFGDNSDKDERFSVKTADEIVDACYKMGAVKTGALIVIEQDIVLEEYIKTGIPVDGIVTSQLLINIFEHNTPLHDGAVIISNNKITITNGMVLSNLTAKIKSSCTIDGYLTLNLKVTSLNSAFTSSGNSTGGLNYALVSYDPETYSTVDVTTLNGKTFDIIGTGAITSTSTIKLKDVQLSKDSTVAYIVIFYLDGDLTNDDAVNTTSNFKATLEGTITQGNLG